jgi:LacI family transcriptional regulator
MARRPTLRDVAAHAGVSFKTVSRVVNGEPGVSPELAARVRAAVEALAFRPNAGARVLRSSSGTAAIAVLLEDIANPFSAAVARAVENVAVARGVMVFTASLDEDEKRERALVHEFGARQADGLIIAPSGDDQSYLATELGTGTAIVCVDREARNLDVDSVITTNHLGAQGAVRHLAAAGHRRIAFLGDRRTIITARHRHEGYRAELAELGLPVDPRLEVHDVRDASMADGVVTALLADAEPPTAIFTAQNLITAGALSALRRQSAERRVALVGFDDLPLADLLTPGVTVVAQDAVAIGRTAAERLFARLEGDRAPGAVTLVPTTLIRRGSGEIPATSHTE